ncbi:MAG TPA: hypothetical protein VIZ90_10260 [Rhizobiaceae bacterium]
MTTIQAFAAGNDINGASVSAIGAFQTAVVGRFDFKPPTTAGYPSTSNAKC